MKGQRTKEDMVLTPVPQITILTENMGEGAQGDENSYSFIIL
jgi:hypothetical protein